jgi:hypothetical protein
VRAFGPEPTRLFCDEVGVAWAELAGERLAALPCGEAVPEVELSPFFFEDLLPSLALESCSCYTG